MTEMQRSTKAPCKARLYISCIVVPVHYTLRFINYTQLRNMHYDRENIMVFELLEWHRSVLSPTLRMELIPVVHQLSVLVGYAAPVQDMTRSEGYHDTAWDFTDARNILALAALNADVGAARMQRRHQIRWD